MIEINLAAVLVAAAANFIIGFLMHGPVAGKVWMKLANITPTGNEKFSDMVPQMVQNFLVNVVCAYILAAVIIVAASYHDNVGSIMGGVVTAFWMWLGFVVTASSMEVIWMGKSYKLWMFEIFATLLSFLAMGAILAAW